MFGVDVKRNNNKLGTFCISYVAYNVEDCLGLGDKYTYKPKTETFEELMDRLMRYRAKVKRAEYSNRITTTVR